MGNSLAAKPKMPKYKKDVMHTIIAVVLYIIIGHVLPYSEPMTGMGMQLVGIFVMTVYLWTTVSTFWPSVLAVFMCGTTGYCTGTVALKECFGHGMTVFVAFMFMFNVAMNESGFSRRIALFFVTRKFVKGKPWLIMFMLMFSVWFVSAFVTSSAVYAMFLSIGEEMLKMTNCDGEDDDLPEAMYCCMAWIDQANQGSTPMSHTNVLLGMSFALTLFGYDIPFMTVMFVGLAACFVMFIVIWLEFRFLQRPNVQKMADLDIDALKATVPPMQKREKWVAGAFIVLIIMWVFPQTIMKIPGLEAFGTMLNRLGTYAPPLLIVAALSIIPCEGKPVLNLKDACTKINWGAWAMMAALMGMATFLGKSDYGVMPYLTEVHRRRNGKARSVRHGYGHYLHHPHRYPDQLHVQYRFRYHVQRLRSHHRRTRRREPHCCCDVRRHDLQLRLHAALREPRHGRVQRSAASPHELQHQVRCDCIRHVHHRYHSRRVPALQRSLPCRHLDSRLICSTYSYRHDCGCSGVHSHAAKNVSENKGDAFPAPLGKTGHKWKKIFC